MDTQGWEVGRDLTFTGPRCFSTSQRRTLGPTGGKFFPNDTQGAFGTISKGAQVGEGIRGLFQSHSALRVGRNLPHSCEHGTIL